jgi:large subunit ribosomal protein L35
MAYKYKPSKSVAKRFKVTKTGKLKRGHAFRSHLMSSRPANKRRKLRRPGILFEGHARNMREFLGLSKLKPAQTAHERALEEKARAEGGEGTSERTNAITSGTGASTARGGRRASGASRATGTRQSTSAGRQQQDQSRSTK